MMLRALGLVLAVTLVGCPSSEATEVQLGTSEVQLTAAPSSTETGAPLPREEVSLPSKLEGWSLPGKVGPELGKPCPADGPEGMPKVQSCGTRNRVSLEAQNKPLRPAADCAMRSLDDPQKPIQQDSRALCVDGDHLLVSVVCIICRVDSGSALHARISELTEGQTKYLHSVLGLKDGPTDAAGWRALYDKSFQKP